MTMDNVGAAQEAKVSKFAALLGTRGIEEQKGSSASAFKASDPAAEASRSITECLSKSSQGHEVVCTLPSLDMKQEESAIPLPKVGEHREVAALLGATVEGDVPRMDASVLSSAADASAKAAQVEQKAAQSLGEITSWTKSSIPYASQAVSKSVANSFSSLVDSRVRAWTLLLLRHSLTSGDSSSRSSLLSMLSSIIKVESAVTGFKTLKLPDSAAGQAKEADVILPLLLEVEMRVSIQNKFDNVTLRAPGTIAANFGTEQDNLGIVKADIRLDTGALLDSMVQQARMVVFKAVAKATSAVESKKTDLGLPGPPISPSSADPNTLAGFSSALNISGVPGIAGSSVPQGPHQPPSHRLQKARSSALKLNSVLQRGPAAPTPASNLDKIRKTRSVQWDHRMDIQPKTPKNNIPSPKRQRTKLVDPAAKLRSFKSFGRAHGGDGGTGPRNATFGDFGRKPVWNSRGVMANRPTPINPAEANVTISVSGTKELGNATFTNDRPVRLSSGVNLGIPLKRRPNPARIAEVPRTVPRTATALEGWLMDKTGAAGGM